MITTRPMALTHCFKLKVFFTLIKYKRSEIRNYPFRWESINRFTNKLKRVCPQEFFFEGLRPLLLFLSLPFPPFPSFSYFPSPRCLPLPRRAAHLNLARFGEGSGLCVSPTGTANTKQPAQRAYKYHKFWGDNLIDAHTPIIEGDASPIPPE